MSSNEEYDTAGKFVEDGAHDGDDQLTDFFEGN